MARTTSTWSGKPSSSSDDRIDSFTGRYRWLSNFAPSSVRYDGVHYPTVEHAYQAAKTLDKEERAGISRALTPGRAKRLGKSVSLRTDWEDIKINVMLDLLRQKFQSLSYKMWLLETGEIELVEGNNRGDTFWGVCRGEGYNYLGKLLMQVRSELRAKK